ncbi:phosphotransferase [Amycolatopsis sp. NPDC059657]|uniref:phosphotransferase n=1 Tax=Amycolatopsis sp. NPDC059657 TaxID=3346899 RepID=UPI00367113BA
MDLTVPPAVVAAVSARWPDRGADWESSVASELVELCRRFDCQPTEVLNARYGLVVAVNSSVGPLVLKSTPDPDGARQAAAARQLAELGIGPAVHDVVQFEFSTWTVMDCVQPGTHAIRSASLPELAELLRPFRTAPATFEFPPISLWLKARLVDDSVVDLPPGIPAAGLKERERALPVLAALVDNESGRLCHGDVSSGNVLRGVSGLQLIDPRAVSGDVEYDVAVLALKAGRKVADLAQLLGVDTARAEAWGTVAIAARV